MVVQIKTVVLNHTVSGKILNESMNTPTKEIICVHSGHGQVMAYIVMGGVRRT